MVFRLNCSCSSPRGLPSGVKGVAKMNRPWEKKISVRAHMTSDFLAHFLTYLPTHVRFCPIIDIHFSILCPIFANLPTYPKIGRHMWTAPYVSEMLFSSIYITISTVMSVRPSVHPYGTPRGRPHMTSDFWVGR